MNLNLLQIHLELLQVHYREGLIRFKEKESEYYSSFYSGSNPLQIVSTDCHTTEDICLVRVPSVVRVPKILISEMPPYVGQRVTSAAAPFGTALPSLLTVPIFEGIFSGYDIATSRYPEYAWYTLSSAPGSSGALILNKEGKLLGVVIGMSMGSHCSRLHSQLLRCPASCPGFH